MNERFPKTEKLKRDKLIEQLFKSGSKVKAFPLLLVYSESALPEKVAVQAGFSVPKRNFKLAVHRNRLKRLMREAYRKRKTQFNVSDKTFAFMFIYMGKEMLGQEEVNRLFEKIIGKFNEKMEIDMDLKTTGNENY